jgi:enterochelin esterase-like enzyme
MHNLLKRAEKEGTPLIDGDSATFVWSGKQAPRLQGDFNNWEWPLGDVVMLQEAAPEVWIHSMKLPRDTYMEYTYMRRDERLTDPYNSRLITNGMGKMNHYFSMPEAKHTALVKRKRNVPAGKVTRHVITGTNAIATKKRLVYLYQPPTDEPCPLLVVLDGKDYVTRAKIAPIVDNLIAQKRIRPIAMALPQHGDAARLVEYMCSDATLGFLILNVLPLAKQHLNLLDIAKNPGACGILGASMGGLMALYAGLRLPEVFGKVISQSGAFGFDLMGKNDLIHDLAQHYERRSIQVWMDVGRYEGLLDANRRMRDLLQMKGYQPVYREYNGGHNYTSWRDELEYGLEAAFGR